MAILSCFEDMKARSWRDNEDGGKEYSHSYVVQVDNSLDHPELAGRAFCVPFKGQAHPINPSAFVTDISATLRSDTFFVYDVQVTYKSKAEDELINPFSRPPRVAWGTIKTQEPFFVDINGKPVINSARQPYDPPPQRDVTRPTLSITRNEPVFDFLDIQSKYDTVNGSPWLGYEAGQVKFSNATASTVEEQISEGVILIYWEVTYEFHFKRPGEVWDELDLLDQGLDELVVDYRENFEEQVSEPFTVLRPITRTLVNEETGDKEVIPITEPVPLDGHGKKFEFPTTEDGEIIPIGEELPDDDGDPETPPPVNQLVYNKFVRYPRVEFADFGFFLQELAFPQGTGT